MAERIFAEVGLDGARTDVIASAAGVNKALLYYYFGSKEELFRAVLDDRLSEFRDRALELLSGPSSSPSKIMAYTGLYFDFIAEHPYFPRLVHRLMTVGDSVVQKGLFHKYRAELFRKLVEVIEEGVRHKDLRPVDPHHTVYSLVALNVFYFSAAPIVKAVSHIDAFAKRNLERRRQEVMNFIRYGLFRDPEASLR